MRFADMALARSVLELLTERQTALVLDALKGEDVQFDDVDLAALLEFVRLVRAELGDVAAADEVEALTQQRPREARGQPLRSAEGRARLIEKSLAIGRDVATRLQQANLPDNVDHLLFNQAGLPHECCAPEPESDPDTRQHRAR